MEPEERSITDRDLLQSPPGDSVSLRHNIGSIPGRGDPTQRVGEESSPRQVVPQVKTFLPLWKVSIGIVRGTF